MEPRGIDDTERVSHTASVIGDTVLVVGGKSTTDSLRTAEQYVPGTGTAMGMWLLANPMNAVRVAHTASVLPNGKILVTGGEDENSMMLSKCRAV